MSLTIISKIRAIPGKEDELARECLKLSKEVREKEGGCLMHVPHISANDPAEIMFIEKYTDQEAFIAHAQSPHFMAFAEKNGGIMEGPPDIESFSEIK